MEDTGDDMQPPVRTEDSDLGYAPRYRHSFESNDDADEPLYKPSYNPVYKDSTSAYPAAELRTAAPEGYGAGGSSSNGGSMPTGSTPHPAAFTSAPVAPGAEPRPGNDGRDDHNYDDDDESLNRVAAYTRSASLSARTAVKAAAAVAARTAALSERLSFRLRGDAEDGPLQQVPPDQGAPHNTAATEPVGGSTAPTAAVDIALGTAASGDSPKHWVDSDVGDAGTPPPLAVEEVGAQGLPARHDAGEAEPVAADGQAPREEVALEAASSPSFAYLATAADSLQQASSPQPYPAMQPEGGAVWHQAEDVAGSRPPRPNESGDAQRWSGGGEAAAATDGASAAAAAAGWHPEPTDRAAFEEVCLQDTGASSATAGGGAAAAWPTTVRHSGCGSVIGTVELPLDPPEFVATVEHPVFDDPDVSAGLDGAAAAGADGSAAAAAPSSQDLLDDYRIAAAAGLVSPELASLLGLAPPPPAAVAAAGDDDGATAAADGALLLRDGQPGVDQEEDDYDEEQVTEAVAAVEAQTEAEQEQLSYRDRGEVVADLLTDSAAAAVAAATAAAPPPVAAAAVDRRAVSGDPFDAADTDDDEGGSFVMEPLAVQSTASAGPATYQQQQPGIPPAALAPAPGPVPPPAAQVGPSQQQPAGGHPGMGVVMGTAAAAAAGVGLVAAAAGQRAAAAAAGAAQQQARCQAVTPQQQWQGSAPGPAPAGHQPPAPPPQHQQPQAFQQGLPPPPPYSVAVLQDQGGQASPPGLPLPTSLRPSASPENAAGPRPGPHPHPQHLQLQHGPPPPGSPSGPPPQQLLPPPAYGSHPSFRAAGGGPVPGGPGPMGPGGAAAMGAIPAAGMQQQGPVPPGPGPFGPQGGPRGPYGAPPMPYPGAPAGAPRPLGMPGPHLAAGPPGVGPGARPPFPGGPGGPPPPMGMPGRGGPPPGFRPPAPGGPGARPPPLLLQAPPPPCPYPGLLYTEGRDTLGRPVVVLNTAMLPAKAKKNDVLQFVLKQLQPVVQREYVVIVLSLGMGVKAGSVSSTWALGAYRSLAKPYRKNVKHIVLVQPSAWARALLALAQPFVSKKAAHKVKKVDNLVQVSEATGGEVKLESLGARFIREIQYGLGAPPLAGLVPTQPPPQQPPQQQGAPGGPGQQQHRPPMGPMGPTQPRGPPGPAGGPPPPGYPAPPYPGPPGSYMPPRPMQPPLPGSAVATPVYGPGGPGPATVGRIQGPPPPRPQFPPGPAGPGGPGAGYGNPAAVLPQGSR